MRNFDDSQEHQARQIAQDASVLFLTHFEINAYRSNHPLQNIARFGRVCVWIVDAEPEFLADKRPKLRLEKRPLFRAIDDRAEAGDSIYSPASVKRRR